jgi:hypothetical protein
VDLGSAIRSPPENRLEHLTGCKWSITFKAESRISVLLQLRQQLDRNANGSLCTLGLR